MSSLTHQDALFACQQLISGCEKMEHLLVSLLDANDSVGEEIHAIRKLGKSLRGGFCLFRIKPAAAEIQAIGRLLSGPRDAVSRLKTWRKLEWSADPKVAAAIAALLEQQTHLAASRPPKETIDWCTERAAAARQSLLDLSEDALDITIEKGLKRLKKQVRKRCLNLDPREAEDFHDARKSLKAYLGALVYLPEGAVVLHPKISQLAELLGDENDLATLSCWLIEHGFTDKFAPDLCKLIAARRHQLQKHVADDAKLLLSGK